jgi:hypothetical protein
MVHKAQEAIYVKRRAIEVRDPTRWASNFKVMKSVRRSRKALQQAVRTEQWSTAFKGQAETTASLVSDAVQNTYKMSREAAEPLYFWEKVDVFLELITPVADAIHQVEAGLPLMSQAWPMLQQLQNHFRTFSAKHSDEDGITDRLLGTFDRGWAARTGGELCWLFAAFLLDPTCAVLKSDGRVSSASLLIGYEHEAAELVRRAGGCKADASDEFLLSGWPDAVKAPVTSLVKRVTGCKRDSEGMLVSMPRITPMQQHLTLRERYASTSEMLLAVLPVAQRLLHAHVTLAATERNRNMWGRIHNASCSALGQERAKITIDICDQARVQRLDADREFHVTLKPVEGEVDGVGD